LRFVLVNFGFYGFLIFNYLRFKVMPRRLRLPTGDDVEFELPTEDELPTGVKLSTEEKFLTDLAEGSLSKYIKSQFQDNLTLLHIAVICNWTRAVGKLIAAGADFDAQDSAGCTPLHYAAESGCAASVLTLIGAGANVKLGDENDSTALHKAAYHGHSEVVRNLIAADADLHAIDSVGGYTPLDLAREKNHGEVIQILKIASGYKEPLRPIAKTADATQTDATRPQTSVNISCGSGAFRKIDNQKVQTNCCVIM